MDELILRARSEEGEDGKRGREMKGKDEEEEDNDEEEDREREEGKGEGRKETGVEIWIRTSSRMDG